MELKEAIEKAEKAGCAISRKAWKLPKDENYYRVLATDTPNNCLTFAGDEMLSKLWAPSKADLIATDWELSKINFNNFSSYEERMKHYKTVWLVDPKEV
ncbi:MAG: DUF2829 domain-containing protein [Lactobacillus sp.]|jgi:hypothetical protein|nr:DUF2829 domain-containing protein [Lactobacillus sp.]